MELAIEELEWMSRSYEGSLDKLRSDIKRTQGYIKRDQEILEGFDKKYVETLDRIADIQKAIRKLREVENG